MSLSLLFWDAVDVPLSTRLANIQHDVASILSGTLYVITNIVNMAIEIWYLLLKGYFRVLPFLKPVCHRLYTLWSNSSKNEKIFISSVFGAMVVAMYIWRERYIQDLYNGCKRIALKTYHRVTSGIIYVWALLGLIISHYTLGFRTNDLLLTIFELVTVVFTSTKLFTQFWQVDWSAKPVKTKELRHRLRLVQKAFRVATLWAIIVTLDYSLHCFKALVYAASLRSLVLRPRALHVVIPESALAKDQTVLVSFIEQVEGSTYHLLILSAIVLCLTKNDKHMLKAHRLVDQLNFFTVSFIFGSHPPPPVRRLPKSSILLALREREIDRPLMQGETNAITAIASKISAFVKNIKTLLFVDVIMAQYGDTAVLNLIMDVFAVSPSLVLLLLPSSLLRLTHTAVFYVFPVTKLLSELRRYDLNSAYNYAVYFTVLYSFEFMYYQTDLMCQLGGFGPHFRLIVCVLASICSRNPSLYTCLILNQTVGGISSIISSLDKPAAIADHPDRLTDKPFDDGEPKPKREVSKLGLGTLKTPRQVNMSETPRVVTSREAGDMFDFMLDTDRAGFKGLRARTLLSPATTVITSEGSRTETTIIEEVEVQTQEHTEVVYETTEEVHHSPIYLQQSSLQQEDSDSVRRFMRDDEVENEDVRGVEGEISDVNSEERDQKVIGEKSDNSSDDKSSTGRTLDEGCDPKSHPAHSEDDEDKGGGFEQSSPSSNVNMMAPKIGSDRDVPEGGCKSGSGNQADDMYIDDDDSMDVEPIDALDIAIDSVTDDEVVVNEGNIGLPAKNVHGVVERTL